jgi:Flp pilus assembly protein TadD
MAVIAFVAAGIICTCAGCESGVQERVRLFNDDGVHQFQQGSFQAARESFTFALELQPEDPAMIYNLGQCCDRLGDLTGAEKCYRDCLRLANQHADCRHALASLLHRTGRRIEATGMTQEWLEANPGLADAYALEGWRLRQDNALPAAQGRLQQALAIDPHNVRALTELGVLYEQMNMPERAFVLYERALVKKPHFPEVTQRLESLRARNVRRPLPD